MEKKPQETSSTSLGPFFLYVRRPLGGGSGRSSSLVLLWFHTRSLLNKIIISILIIKDEKETYLGSRRLCISTPCGGGGVNNK